jgi:hypothetical protein
VDMTKLPRPIEAFIVWITYVGFMLAGMLPASLLVFGFVCLLPTSIVDAPVAEISAASWGLLVATVAAFFALAGFGIYAVSNLFWFPFAEKRFSPWSLGLLAGGERNLPKLRASSLKWRQAACRITRR